MVLLWSRAVNRGRIFVVALLAALGCKHAGKKPTRGIVKVQLLAFNDFHGNLRPPGRGWYEDGEELPAGGADYFAAHVAKYRAENPNTVVVSAGDLVGASPLLSALFHDEPTIEAMNAIGLDFNGVGNHEFDEGPEELVRLAKGGCHPKDGCQDGTPYEGAKFGFLAANVHRADSTLFPPYAIREFEGVKIAFIGMTLEGTPNVVPPVIEGLDFSDEADTANALAEKLAKEGVHAVVVIVHEGGFAKGGYNGCRDASGPIVDVVKRMSAAIDVVVSGHTHQAYNCVIDRKRVTSAGSFGRLLTKIDLTIDGADGNIVRADAKNVIITHDVDADEAIGKLVDRYEKLAAPLADEVVGHITEPLTKRENPAGESALGTVIADAQLAATRAADKGGAQLAIMNAGGVRTDLEKAGEVTFGQIFAVQPFGNTLVTMSLTGEQLDQVLEDQWGGDRARMLNLSSSVEYSWSRSAPVGEKVDIASIRVDGKPVEAGGTYRVTVNNYLADRGLLSKGTDRTPGVLDLDALVAYLAANDPLAPPTLFRIRSVP